MPDKNINAIPENAIPTKADITVRFVAENVVATLPIISKGTPTLAKTFPIFLQSLFFTAYPPSTLYCSRLHVRYFALFLYTSPDILLSSL